MTDKKDKALKLALEALEFIRRWGEPEEGILKRDDAITALRKALAEQPAQKQKPVPSIIQMLGHCPECGAKAHHFTSPPASKPWVGLTDEQRDAIEQRIYCQTIQKGKTRGEYVNKVMCAIEAKLREKNNG